MCALVGASIVTGFGVDGAFRDPGTTSQIEGRDRVGSVSISVWVIAPLQQDSMDRMGYIEQRVGGEVEIMEVAFAETWKAAATRED